MRILRKLRKKIRWHIIDILARLGIGDVEVVRQGRRPAYGRAEPRELSVPVGDEPFCAHDALHGSTCSPEHCADIRHSVWAEIGAASACIRYYPAGLSPDRNRLALLYFSGDAVLRTARGIRCVSETYTQQTPNRLTELMAEWSSEAGAPAIFMARPGIFGSSGDHERRRQSYEIDLMDRALDLLKYRHRIERFILVGQSGGGQIVAALLNRRRDIAASVIAAGLLSVHHTVRHWRRTRPVPGGAVYPVEALYDPLRDVALIHREPAPDIYLISDPRDNVISLQSQLLYFRKLQSEGLTPHHIYAHAMGAKRHYLAQHGRKAAALLARGAAVRDIRQALVDLDVANLGEARKPDYPALAAAEE